jgi:hypothetical protein
MNIERRTLNAEHRMVPDETIGRLMFAISVGRASSRAGSGRTALAQDRAWRGIPFGNGGEMNIERRTLNAKHRITERGIRSAFDVRCSAFDVSRFCKSVTIGASMSGSI